MVVSGREPKGVRALPARLPQKTFAGGVKILPDVPVLPSNYGMNVLGPMIGYYDRTLFPNIYTGPANGGVCPMTNAEWGSGECPFAASHLGIDGRVTRGHVDDYWIAPGNADPDPYITGGWPEHTPEDCIGDFVDASKSKYSLPDGYITFWTYNNGDPDYNYQDASGHRCICRGLRLFLESRGYTVRRNFCQLLPGVKGNTNGFTFNNYQAQIDAGRPVLIYYTSFYMLSTGYNANANTIYLRGSTGIIYEVPWAGTFSGESMYAVTVVELDSDRPFAYHQSVTTPEDTPATITLEALDPLGGTVTYQVLTQPVHGHLTGTAPDLVYTPDPYWNSADGRGADTFTFKVTAGAAESNTATVEITVSAVNSPPEAEGQAVDTDEDTPLPITLGAHDAPYESTTFDFRIGRVPAHGTLSGTAPNLTYTPDPDWNSADGRGPDTFTFIANDGEADSNAATVTVTVNAVNDAPVANHDAFSTDEDTPLAVAAPGVLENDEDVDGDPLTTELVTGTVHGELALHSDGSFTYKPGADFNGADTFVYSINDGQLDSGNARVTITVNAVNDAPVAAGESYSTDEDTPLNVPAPGILGNDTDVENNPLEAVKVTGPAHGTLMLSSDGSFSYLPAVDWHGIDGFTYTANDGELDSNTARVTIDVRAVNDAPVAGNDTYTTDEDVPLIVPAPGVLSNDTDVDGDPLTAVLVTGPAHGTLALNAGGDFFYTPAADWYGADGFTYKANDGTADSTIARVTITVNAVNDAPVAAGESYSTDEDTPLNISAPGILGNDTDVENNPLVAVKVTGPAHGTLTLGSDGSFSYLPATDWYGTDSFTYTANDGKLDSNTVRVTINVRAVNDAPVAGNDTYTTDEDVPLIVPAPGVLSNDADVDGDPLTAVLVTGPAHGTLALNAGGDFSYTPAADWYGTDGFTYKANDGTADSTIARVTITVNAVNDAPVAAGESYSTDEDTPLNVPAPGVLENDTDIDGDTLAAKLANGPGHGVLTLNSDGSVVYLPSTDWHGVDGFTYRANDGELDSNAARVTISVTSVNDAPVAGNDAYTTDEDEPLAVPAPGVLGNDADVDGDPLSATLASGPGHGALTLLADGGFTYAPAADWHGPDTFTYRANDGALDSNAARVTITVGATNDPPVAAGDVYNTDEDIPLAIQAPGILGNDTDVDGDPLTVILVTGAGHGTLAMSADGGFTYTPAADWSGTDTFTYQASDGQAHSNPVTVSLIIRAVNDPPVARGDRYAVHRYAPLPVAAPGVLGNDSDVEGDALTAQLAGGPARGTLTLLGDGSFTYLPPDEWLGTDTFTYCASDGRLTSAPATVTIDVDSTNDPPIAVPLTAVTAEDTPVHITLTGSDPDGDPLTYKVTVPPAHGRLTGLAPHFTYTPVRNWNGADTFTYLVHDGRLASNLAHVTITVRPVNDPPVSAPLQVAAIAGVPCIIDVLAAVTDIDGDALTLSDAGPAAHGTVAIQDAGHAGYTAPVGYTGSDQFTCTVEDAHGGTTTVTVLVQVYAPLTACRLSATPPSPQSVNTPITLTAFATGGHQLQYYFRAGYVANGNWYWPYARAYSPANSWTWTPAIPGTYTVVVTILDQTGGQTVSATLVFQVNGTLASVDFTTNPASPQPVNTPVTITATATGGLNVLYRIWCVYRDSTGQWQWRELQAYSPNRTITWKPALPGTYTIVVWAREATSRASYDVYRARSYTIR